MPSAEEVQSFFLPWEPPKDSDAETMPLFVTGGEKLAELVKSVAFLRVRGTRSNRSFLLPLTLSHNSAAA